MALSLATLGGIFGAGASLGGAKSDPAGALLALRRAQSKGAEAKGVALEQKDPVTLTALAQFRRAVDGAKDIKQALRDPRVLAVLLPAMGLSDQRDYPGLVQQALLADSKDSKGLLASLDARFKDAATTLDLRAKGLAGLKDPKLLKTLSDGFLQYQYQSGLDDKTSGLSDALYFIKNASGVKDVYGILGNGVMRRVVTGALGLPLAMAVQPIETQARAITTRMKLEELQDPKKVQLLAQRYLMAQADGGAGGNSLVSLFA
jgi:hypothetical protein